VTILEQFNSAIILMNVAQRLKLMLMAARVSKTGNLIGVEHDKVIAKNEIGFIKGLQQRSSCIAELYYKQVDF
jgi:hypothetical protein